MTFEKCVDRSVCFTLSLYVSRRSVRTTLSIIPNGPQMRAFQRGFHDSLRLRDAIDPLFNDIADRERLGQVDDTLLDVDGPSQGEIVSMTIPDMVSWTTEGVQFNARPSGLGKTRTLRLRRFWYAHRDGAFSYHLSFGVQYDHSPADFYFLSLLQKLVAPKEFLASPLPATKKAWRPTDTETGVFPLDKIKVADASQLSETFWQFVSRRFEADAQNMFGALASHLKVPRIKPDATRFEAMVDHVPFIEVPDLEMPKSRFMFFFQDQTFFRRLLPPTDPVTGLRPRRSSMVQRGCYTAYPSKIQEQVERCPDPVRPVVELDDDYWGWALSRYADTRQEDVAAIKARIPAFEPGRADCLHYLFTAGFNQNIIDFMNQDASEVLDSIDPIYPTNEQQEDESFFVRFASPRSIVTYVETSRSLETGNDYIGTCPYAFLIHVIAMHNDFLARDYEEQTFRLLADVRDLSSRGRFHAAAKRFYHFRMHVQANYYRDRYVGVFRYDTEKDVFDAVEQTRGTKRKSDYLEQLVSNTESQTRDLEARILKKDEAAIGGLLGALGIFGFFGLLFNWAEATQKFYDKYGSSFLTISADMPFIEANTNVVNTNAERLAAFAISGAFVLTILLFLGLCWITVRRLWRLWLSWRQGKTHR
jgi:hypothetical protein